MASTVLPALTDGKRRIVDRLKRTGTAEAGDLAHDLGLTSAAVRQHLTELERSGLVEGETGAPQGRGRPPFVWKLTPLALELFPDRHADLTVELISSIRSALGEDGLERVVATRTENQRKAYAKTVPHGTKVSVRKRVDALADRRTAEGYMAEVVDQGDAGVVLLEHHCPVCEAASSCTMLCRAELDLFQSVLGKDVRVEREQHLLSGDVRCAYRITPA